MNLFSCEGCGRAAELLVNGYPVCLAHVDLPSEEGEAPTVEALPVAEVRDELHRRTYTSERAYSVALYRRGMHRLAARKFAANAFLSARARARAELRERASRIKLVRGA